MLFLEKLEQKSKIIINIIVTCIIIGILCSVFFIPKETFSVSRFLILEQREENNIIRNKGNLEISEDTVKTYETILKSDSVIAQIRNELKIYDSNINLKSSIIIKKLANSNTLEIKVLNKEHVMANEINQKLIENFSQKIKEIKDNSEVYIVDNPHIETKTNIKNIIMFNIACGLFGIAISCSYVVILIILEKRAKDSKSIENELALKTLIKIPLNKEKSKKNSELITCIDERLLISKVFKKLRSNIQFINVNNKEKNIILVTSPKSKEGKSFIAANIAISFAEVGKKVILIDTDMIHGRIGKMFDVPNNLGLSNYLSGLDTNGVEINELINKFINESTIKNLNIITSGTIPPNSSELLTSSKLSEMVKDLSVFYDMVILDGTGVLNSTDSLILTRIATSTILVSDYKKTSKDDLWKSKRDIQNVGGRIIGIILNKAKVKEKIYKLDGEKKTVKLKDQLKETLKRIKKYIEEKKAEKEHKLLEAGKVNEDVVFPKKETQTTNLNEETVAEENETTDEKKQEEQVRVKIDYSNIRNKTLLEKIKIVLDNGKEKILLASKKSKEKVSSLINDFKTKIDEINARRIEREKIKLEEIKEELAQEKINQSKEIIRENSITEEVLEESDKKKDTENDDQISFEDIAEDEIELDVEDETENEIDTKPSKENSEFIDYRTAELYNPDPEKTALVIIDAEKGFCRVFSKDCFTEKLIRGIDKNDGFIKAHYSANLIKRRRLGLMASYGLTQKQINRVDTLIYITLCDYDDCIWIERKTTSNKADAYIKCITKEYDRMPDERRKDYEARCQYLRKLELLKNQIEIEYNLDNIWTSKAITIMDKIVLKKFAKSYDKFFKEKNENATFIRKGINFIKNMNFSKNKNISYNLENENIAENDYDFINDEYEKEELAIREEEEKLLYEQKQEQERIKQEKREKKLQEKLKKKEEKIKQKEENRKNRAIEKEKARQEARIEEELLDDNLYPKTKNNKSL